MCMKFKKWLLVTMLLLLLTGCTPVGSGRTHTTTSKTPGLTTSSPTANKSNGSANQTLSTTELVNMTAEQIGRYDEINGGAPPFGGTSVVRIKKSQAPSAIPDGYKYQPENLVFVQKEYTIIDSWKGYLRGKPFLLDFYSNDRTHNVIVGLAYDHRPIIAFSLHSARYVIKNFTGSYIVLGVPWIHGPFYAINLMTGRIIYPGKLTMQMCGCYPCQGAGGPLWITGLPQKYPFRQYV